MAFLLHFLFDTLAQSRAFWCSMEQKKNLEKYFSSPHSTAASGIKSLSDLHAACVAYPPNDEDDHKFATLFASAQRVLGLKRTELGDIFRIGAGGVDLWMRGENSPHPLGRKPVFDVIARMAAERLQQAKEQPQAPTEPGPQ